VQRDVAAAWNLHRLFGALAADAHQMGSAMHRENPWRFTDYAAINPHPTAFGGGRGIDAALRAIDEGGWLFGVGLRS
jgi:hypothetical protein